MTPSADPAAGERSFAPPRARPERPWWLLAAALVTVVFLWFIVADRDYSIIFRALSKGIATTLYVTAVAFSLAIAVALVVALARTSNAAVLRQIATFYTEIVRGIPVLVLLFYVAFVGAPWFVDAFNALISPLVNAGIVGEMHIRQFDLSWRAIIALTISYSAFVAEIFRAGIQSVDRGQVEAARS
ncbi:MAG TPA: ABC transporter permease subunit, partial [Devosiaceae bacterium]|nr:ABC transporter permease subunit [Devosiaceae bacterium]